MELFGKKFDRSDPYHRQVAGMVNQYRLFREDVLPNERAVLTQKKFGMLQGVIGDWNKGTTEKTDVRGRFRTLIKEPEVSSRLSEESIKSLFRANARVFAFLAPCREMLELCHAYCATGGTAYAPGSLLFRAMSATESKILGIRIHDLLLAADDPVLFMQYAYYGCVTPAFIRHLLPVQSATFFSRGEDFLKAMVKIEDKNRFQLVPEGFTSNAVATPIGAARSTHHEPNWKADYRKNAQGQDVEISEEMSAAFSRFRHAFALGKLVKRQQKSLNEFRKIILANRSREKLTNAVDGLRRKIPQQAQNGFAELHNIYATGKLQSLSNEVPNVWIDGRQLEAVFEVRYSGNWRWRGTPMGYASDLETRGWVDDDAVMPCELMS